MSTRVARPDELDLCLDVRREVFVEGQNVPLDLEVDGLDPDCTHIVSFDEDGRVVGAARLRITPEGYAKAERVAVRDAARGRGLGAALMDALEAEAQRLGHHEVRLSAQVPVVEFYERRGYVGWGEVYEEAGIPHRKMKKDLSA